MAADVEVTGSGLESSTLVVVGDRWFVFLDFPSFLIKRFIVEEGCDTQCAVKVVDKKKNAADYVSTVTRFVQLRLYCELTWG